jgi:hypothetical protein
MDQWGVTACDELAEKFDHVVLQTGRHLQNKPEQTKDLLAHLTAAACARTCPLASHWLCDPRQQQLHVVSGSARTSRCTAGLSLVRQGVQ